MAIKEQDLILLALEDIQNFRHFVVAAFYGIQTSIGAIQHLDLLKEAGNVLRTPGRFLPGDAYKERLSAVAPNRIFDDRPQPNGHISVNRRYANFIQIR